MINLRERTSSTIMHFFIFRDLSINIKIMGESDINKSVNKLFNCAIQKSFQFYNISHFCP